ncbi:hypothetical protein [Streptomyces sp. NPDC058964]|uniref:hypothetical protein n=1 Tax=Streptomyces sp. NPDC058964 TaxID=3346681 RepID=UPI003693C516
MSGKGVWLIFEYQGMQTLDIKIGQTVTSFDLYAPGGRLLVSWTVGDPDDANLCEFTEHRKYHRPSDRRSRTYLQQRAGTGRGLV